MNPEQLQRLGHRVLRARLAQGWSKEQAAREARISSITWKRVEDGLGVQDVKRARVLEVLGLDDRGEPVGGSSQDEGYVTAPGPRARSGVSDEEVLALIEDVRSRLDAIERRIRGPQPLDGAAGDA
jgi:transcriptional regulator with XRE-family HTH domain